MRTDLCDEALRVGRILARLAPEEPEVHGLVALMEIQASRAAARVTRDGTPILLLEQDRARWDQILIRRGLAALAEAEALGGASGSYALQAAIAACHARALRAADTEWPRIASLYDELAIGGIVADRRTQSCGGSRHAGWAGRGPRLIEPLMELPLLRNYHLLPSVRGDFLSRLGRFDEAREEFARAAEMTQNVRERELLLKRAGGQG